MTSKSSENAVNTLQVEGACHCGSIRFKALVDPRKVMVCHCSGCQHLTGSALRAVASAR